jgi:hypothetical protein
MLNPAGNPQREKRDGHNMLLLNFGFKKSDILRLSLSDPPCDMLKINPEFDGAPTTYFLANICNLIEVHVCFVYPRILNGVKI